MSARKLRLAAMSVFAGLLSFTVVALAGPGGGAGGGGGGKGGGSTGGTSPDLGDLIVLYRDADGIPILTADSCQQPLAAPGVTLPAIGTTPQCVPGSATQCQILQG